MPEDAADAHGQAPIIIKKKKGGGEGHHGGAWKVAYADMVTALMALFIVLWILNSSEEVKQSVAHHFSPSEFGFKDGGAPTVQQGAGSSNQLKVLENLPTQGGTDQGGKSRMLHQASELQKAIDKVPSFGKYRDQIEISITKEGVRINLLESKDTPLFRSGSTDLNSDAQELLAAVGKEISRSGSSIVIEGHTDATPFHSASAKTNWELSTGRAQTARRLFESVSVPPERILEIRGFADRQLYNPLDPVDSRNRRVSILLLSQETLQRRKAIPQETLIPWLAE